jgi:hypothetical protein
MHGWQWGRFLATSIKTLLCAAQSPSMGLSTVFTDCIYIAYSEVE